MHLIRHGKPAMQSQATVPGYFRTAEGARKLRLRFAEREPRLIRIVRDLAQRNLLHDRRVQHIR